MTRTKTTSSALGQAVGGAGWVLALAAAWLWPRSVLRRRVLR